MVVFTPQEMAEPAATAAAEAAAWVVAVAVGGDRFVSSPPKMFRWVIIESKPPVRGAALPRARVDGVERSERQGTHSSDGYFRASPWL